MLSSLNSEPRTRPTPASQRSQDASFEVQRRELNLRHDREALAAERQQLAQERRQLERDRQNFEEQVEERREQQHVEQRAVEATASAEQMAGDLRHDIDNNEPGYTAAAILAAGRKARGLSGIEEPTGQALAIVNAGRRARGEIVSDAPPLPENPTARAIILSSQRAEGKAISESDATWLSAFLQRQEHDRNR